MIRNTERWQAFEAAWVASQAPDHAENLRLADGMYQLARTLGSFTPEDALDGFEKDLRLAARVHRVRKSP